MPSDLFSDREKGYEAKYKLDEEHKFRAYNRRNRLFGQWVAAQLGKTGADIDAYAKEVVAADFEKPGHDDVIDKVVADLTKAGKPADRDTLLAEYARFLGAAMEQVSKEA
jgi:hypothetical protein